MEPRPYQTEAVQAAYCAIEASEDSHPCISMPTGTGKSVVIAMIIRDAVTRWGGRVMVLAHVRELLQQNAEKIAALCPDIPVGIYSAGLKARETQAPVVVAGIQSVYSRACEFDRRDLVIVDEAHLIPPDGEGMYRTFLNAARVVTPHQRVIGLTATPYRLAGGPICAPGNILTEVCYEVGLRAMIDDGYLCPLVGRAAKTKSSMDGVHIRGGEYIPAEMAAAFDADAVVRAACEELITLTTERRHVLIFAASVRHAEHIRDTLRELTGEPVGLVTGDTPPQERADTIARFRGREVMPDLLRRPLPPLRWLVNVNVLTTGFDAPETDCVALMRSTMSPGLLVQMVGRGTRIAPHKSDCLVLDYGENLVTHGPVDAIRPPRAPGERDGDGGPLGRECPQCRAVVPISVLTCPDCGHEFPPPPPRVPHGAWAGNAPVLSVAKPPRVEPVVSVSYSVHRKRGAADDAPRTMRVTYALGNLSEISEWVCPEHRGFARSKFVTWWKSRTLAPVPDTSSAAVAAACSGLLLEPIAVTLRDVPGERWPELVAYQWPVDATPPGADAVTLPEPEPVGEILDGEDLSW